MNTRRALTSSRPKSGSSDPASTRASIRPPSVSARMPLSSASVRMPWTIGKVPAFLTSICVRADADRGHDGAEPPTRGRREGLDQVGEPRQERALAAQELEQRLLGPREQIRRARSRRLASEKMARFMAASGSRAEHPGLELADEAVDRLRPDRVADHDIAGAGREPEAVQRPGKGVSERARSVSGTGRPDRMPLSWSVRTVCSPRPSDPIIIRQPLSRIEGGATISNSLTNSRRVEVGGDLGDGVDLDALLVKPLDLGLDVLRRHREIVEAARAVDPPGDELRVAGEQTQDVDVLQEADIGAVGLDRRGAACCAASSAAAPRR